MKLLRSIIFFSLFTCFKAQAQLQFNSIDGLSQNTVYSIMKDKQGFLWIATGNGLNRFDGAEMKIYKPSFGAGNGQMRGRIIRSDLLEDDDEKIWFSTDITLHCFNKKTDKFTAFYLDKHLKVYTDASKGHGLFANVLLVKDSLIWLANSSNGLYSINRFTMQVKQFPIVHKDEAGNIINIMYNGAYDGRDKFWFASKKGILSFQISSGTWYQHLKEYPFYSIALNKDTLYACWEKEIFTINTHSLALSKSVVQQQQSLLFNAPASLRRMYKDGFGQIWAGDEKGNVFLKKPKSGFFEWAGNINGSAKPETSFPVYCIFNFDNQQLWVGADALGLQKAEIRNPPFYTCPSSTNSTASNKRFFVHSIFEDEAGQVWLGSFQRGIFLLDKKNNSVKEVKLPYKESVGYYNNSVPLIKSDSKGNLWTSTSGYLFIRQVGQKNFMPLKLPVPSNSLQEPQMWSMTEYNNGWLIGTNIGFYYISENEKKYTISHLTHLGMQRMAGAWVHPDKTLWLAPQTGGIWIIKNLESNEKPKKIFEETNIKSFYYDAKHRLLWIGSASGLIAYYLPNNQYKIYSEEDGLLNSFIYGILPDENNLWVSTNKCLSKAETVFKSGKIFPDIRVTNFTTNDGLPANEFNTGAFYKGSSGYMYFGSVNGVTWFRPSNVKFIQDTPVVRIVQALVNDEKADTALAPEYIRQIVLPWHKNTLHLRFRGIDYNAPSAVKYMYKLEGWDKDWVHSNMNEVHYNKLPPDKYKFLVKAANQSGIWTETPYEITVIIHPPFWKTWWFYSLALISCIATIIVTTRRLVQRKLKLKIAQLERQRAVDKERQRISREMHDDIGAGLTQIVLMSESARIKSKSENSKELTDIAHTSRMLVSSMSEIIWSLNSENKTLDQLLSYLREYVNKQLEYSGINYTVAIAEIDKSIVVSNEQMRNILLIAKETVNNAIKHSRAKNIIVKSAYQSGNLQIEIKDDGVGFSMQEKYPGNGLRNIRQRVAEIKGELKIETVAGKSSRFMYAFPLNTTNLTSH